MSLADLLPDHLVQLRQGSGISDAVIDERNYQSITSRTTRLLEQLGFAREQRRAPGLLLPLHTTDGSVSSMAIYRSDRPRIVQGAALKYENPKGAGLRIDCPPRCRAALGDPGIGLWITEGQKKADALASHGLIAIDVLGVWGFKSRNQFGARVFSADLDYVGWDHRDVSVCFDSDVMLKPTVQRALEQFAEHLIRKGAVVTPIYLPAGLNGTKNGVDDFLVNHPIEQLLALAKQPPPKVEPERPTVEILDERAPKLDRLLQRIGEHGYAVSWVPVRITVRQAINPDTGQLDLYDPPLAIDEERQVVVRDDGEVFGLETPLDRLPFGLELEATVLPALHWQPSGVRAYRQGRRVAVADLFERLVASIDAFVDFRGSTADQLTMCRAAATETLATWFISELDTAPYVQAAGEFEAGKSRFIGTLVALSHLGMLVTEASTFATLRDLAHLGGALGIDEREQSAKVRTQSAEEENRRALILNGYQRSDTLIGHKEPSPGGGWHTVYSRTFSPRFFAAISLPDAVLASRTWVVPLVRSADPRRTTRSLQDLSSWPTDRRKLHADLWAFALERLPSIRACWDAVPTHFTWLHGRELEVWRPALSVALLLENANITSATTALYTVIQAYRSEREALVSEVDANRLILLALAAELQAAHTTPDSCGTTGDALGVLADCSVELRVTAATLAERITGLAADLDAGLVRGVSVAEIGKRLRHPLRLGRTEREGHTGRRFRLIRGAELCAPFDTHAIPHEHPDSGDRVTVGDGGDSTRGGFQDDMTHATPGISHVISEPSANGVTPVTPVTLSPSGDTAESLDTARGTSPPDLTKPGDSISHVITEPHATAVSTVSTVTLSAADDVDSTTFPTPAYTLVTTAEQLADVAAIVTTTDLVAIDTETTGLNPLHAQLRLIQFACAEGVYILDVAQLPTDPLAQLVHQLFTAPHGPRLVFHNAVFDIRFLQIALGLDLEATIPCATRLFDTLIAARITDARGKTRAEDAGGPPMRYGLRDVVQRHLGVELSKGEQKAGWDQDVLPERKLQYAARDAAATLAMARRLGELLEREGLCSVLHLEMQVLEAVVWMTNAGAPIDREQWLATIPDSEVTRLELNTLAGLDPYETRVWNTAGAIKKLFAARGLELPNTTKSTLRELADRDPLIPLLLAYRGEAKARSTYGERMLDGWLSPTGRLHPSWQALGTDTGRMACRTVPFHGIPRDSRYRQAVRAPAGRVLVKADYGQLQVRISAQLANDTAMLEVFDHDGDIHRATVAAMLGLPAEQVSSGQRQLGKGVVFGLLFGQGAEGLQQYLKDSYGISVTRAEASKLRHRFFQTWPGLRRRMEHPNNKNGHRATIVDPSGSGRRRLDISSQHDHLNTPVQMVEAHGFKRALVRLYQERTAHPSATLIAAVHDELVLETDAAAASADAAWLQRVMVEEMRAVVPGTAITVDVTIGQDWAGTPLEVPMA